MMLRSMAKITGKGHVQIPAPIRRAINAAIGDELIFTVVDDKKVTIEVAKKGKLTELGGILAGQKAFTDIENESEKTKKLWVKKRMENKQ